MENPSENKSKFGPDQWEDVCGLPSGCHTIPIWGRCVRVIHSSITRFRDGLPKDIESQIVYQKAVLGVVQIHVAGGGSVISREVFNFKNPILRTDMPDTRDLSSDVFPELEKLVLERDLIRRGVRAELEKLKSNDEKK